MALFLGEEGLILFMFVYCRLFGRTLDGRQPENSGNLGDLLALLKYIKGCLRCATNM